MRRRCKNASVNLQAWAEQQYDGTSTYSASSMWGWTRGSESSCGSHWSADASLLPVTLRCHQRIHEGRFPQRIRSCAAFNTSKQSFWKILAELLSHWAEDDASVWTEIENFPCEIFSCRAPMGDELQEIYCLSHISQWCIVAVLLVYLSMGL